MVFDNGRKTLGMSSVGEVLEVRSSKHPVPCDASAQATQLRTRVTTLRTFCQELECAQESQSGHYLVFARDAQVGVERLQLLTTAAA